MNIESPLLKNSFSGGTVLEITDDYTLVSTNPLTEGVFTGTDGIPRLREFEQFAPYAYLLTGQEILPDGHAVGDVLPSTRVGGILLDPVVRADTRDVNCKAKFLHSDITPAERLEIQSGKPGDGSLAYRCNLDKTPGKWNGKPYMERELAPYRFFHYAKVPHGAATIADGAGFNLNSSYKNGDGKLTPDDETKLMQSVADLAKTVTALTAKIEGLASVDDLKKIQATVEEDQKLKQAAAEDADFAAFTQELNAANRSADVAKKLYQESKVAPSKWRADHPDLLLKNSSTAEDLVLKGDTVASNPGPSDVRMQARQKMIDARDKKLQEA